MGVLKRKCVCVTSKSFPTSMLHTYQWCQMARCCWWIMFGKRKHYVWPRTPVSVITIHPQTFWFWFVINSVANKTSAMYSAWHTSTLQHCFVDNTWYIGLLIGYLLTCKHNIFLKKFNTKFRKVIECSTFLIVMMPK